MYFGDHRYADRLRDHSPEAVVKRNAALAAFHKRAMQIDAMRLSPQDRASLRVLRFRLDSAVAINGLHGSLPFGVFDEFAPLTQQGGLHLMLPQLAKASRFTSVGDYEAWLKRLEAVPASVAQLIERMQIAIDSGWMPPRVAIARLPAFQVLAARHRRSAATPPAASCPTHHPRASDASVSVAESLLRDALPAGCNGKQRTFPSAARLAVLPGLAQMVYDN
jgi:uncharacterized protein (DUF885 family)